MTAAAFGLAVLLILLPGSAGASPATDAADSGFDCRRPGFAWSDHLPPINRRHVFCGEIRDGEPKGFHALALRPTARLVRAVERRAGERRGIYQAIVQFANGRRKLSTFFPDRCTVEEITRSIHHAASHPGGRHPAWGEIGPSAPTDGAGGFCLDDDGRRFEIRFSRLKDGRINTAFPN
jgi:hypothetical protein